MRPQNLFAAVAATLALASPGVTSAAAPKIPYPHAGTYNATTYSFTASASGDVIAYFAGGLASYDNKVGLLDNGKLTSAGYELDDKTSKVGEAFDLSAVKAGDKLVFVLDNVTLGAKAYSDPTMNFAYDHSWRFGGLYFGGDNHIYSTPYSASSDLFPGVPSGTYVGFEDQPYNLGSKGSDHDYNDEQFVFAISAAPEPSTWLLMIAGVGLTGAALRRKPRPALAALKSRA